MIDCEDRFSMSAEKYLAKHHLVVYLEDSIAQLLEHKEENPKVVPIKFLTEYFSCLKNGNHTMFREFNFIRATPHNRASFIQLFWKCYRQIGKKGDLLSIQEYHSLLGLICPDFPFSLVQKTVRIVFIDDALDCLISFSDFIYALQAQFFFEEFLDRCGEIYQSLLQMNCSPRDPVVVPTSGSDDTLIHQNHRYPTDGIDSMQFFRAISPLCDKANFSTPPASLLRDILQAIPRVSFYGFLMSIAKSDAINDHIGRLPHKSELLDSSDVELPLPSSRPIKSNFSQPVSSHSASSDHVPSRPASIPLPLSASALSSQIQTSERPRSSQTFKLNQRVLREVSHASTSESSSSTESSDTN